MGKHIDGPIPFEALTGDDQPESMEEMPAGHGGIRMGAHEIIATPAELAELGRMLVVTFGEQGAGLSVGTEYFVTHRQGRPGPGSAFAIVGRELVEAYEWTDAATPDWETASLCDPCRGDEGFFHPAWALLRWMNTEQVGETSWVKQDHDDLAKALRETGVESWTYDGTQGCYRVSVAADEEYAIRTPAEAVAYVAGLRAVR